ncbi:MAG TPA: hypothetical protein VFP84_05100 [Kofleriaceae bacterium]|nr:hypothetical protein [Kofleriaceae bacterium]
MGFPSAWDAQGVQAGADAKIGLQSSSSADLFARVGGIGFSWVRADVLGEGFDADVPQFAEHDPSGVQRKKNSFSAVGIRARFNFANPEWQNEGITTKDAHWAATAGLRLVQRSVTAEDLTKLGGFQWELGVRRDSDAQVDDLTSSSVMVGLSGLHLDRSSAMVDETLTRYVRMNDLRLSVALELRQSSGTSSPNSALGIYNVLSHDYWKNPATNQKNGTWQYEIGVYINGVMQGFSGIVMASIVRPYGGGSQNVYAISVIPFGGAEIPK